MEGRLKSRADSIGHRSAKSSPAVARPAGASGVLVSVHLTISTSGFTESTVIPSPSLVVGTHGGVVPIYTSVSRPQDTASPALQDVVLSREPGDSGVASFHRHNRWSPHHGVRVEHMVGNVAKTVGELAEESQSWAARAETRYQMLQRQLQVSLHSILLFSHRTTCLSWFSKCHLLRVCFLFVVGVVRVW